MLEFAFTLKPDMTPDHIVELTRQAEPTVSGYGWIFDSHVLWQEPYPLLTIDGSQYTQDAPRNMRDESGGS